MTKRKKKITKEQKDYREGLKRWRQFEQVNKRFAKMGLVGFEELQKAKKK